MNMEVKEKTHHHFVPQVYLRKFHHTLEKRGKNKTFFVSSFDKIENTENLHVNVRDICAEDKLYTIESSDINIRESIENFYARTIENDYNTFYNLLTNSAVTVITKKQRELIISTVVNLHLRNFFWLKIFNNFWTSLINRYPDGFNDIIYDEKDNILFDFSSQTKEQVTESSHKQNKQAFIKSHLEMTVSWTKHHFKDFIIVDRIPENSQAKFITSDKPVIGGTLNSSLRLALDPFHMLTLIPPPSDMNSDLSVINRNSPLVSPELINIMHYQNAEQLIIAHDIKDIVTAKSNYERAKHRQQ